MDKRGRPTQGAFDVIGVATATPFLGRLLFTLSFTALILILSVTPDQPMQGDSVFVWLVVTTPTLVQKTLHLVVYGALATLWIWTLVARASVWTSQIAAILVAIGFGAIREWCQTCLPGRFGSLYDVVLNGLGAFAGLLVYTTTTRRLAGR